MIAIIDYDMGNLRSIAKALEHVGGTVIVTRDPETIARAEKIVLPGVGAFRDGISHLETEGMKEALNREVRENKKPLLGICLGMQLLADKSYEFGAGEGLGYIHGEVHRFAGDNLRVPHVGWNAVSVRTPHVLFSGIPADADFYFVHSYHLVCERTEDVLATCEYGGSFVAAIARDNIVATQFHPEKSQKHGLRLLKNFVAWTGESVC